MSIRAFLNRCSIYYCIYDKRREFPFIVKRFPHYVSNIRKETFKAVYLTQCIRFFEGSQNLEDFDKNVDIMDEQFLSRGVPLETIQNLRVECTDRSLWRFIDVSHCAYIIEQARELKHRN